MKLPLYKAKTKKDNEEIFFTTIFQRSELSNIPIPKYLPERHYDEVIRTYAVLDEIDLNCLIGRHKEIDETTLEISIDHENWIKL